ncbi:ABC-type antimicrobial peptide transport system permease subunit [Spirosoma oryzae]|uniref:ABC-type antimicrobial peptide transport system permease subunit n=1 Tax=Spirosoma oryzae TaxID=1469603 RepID=A0A2T0T5Y6_9BACT|nr:ABC transporter permease [Spirosoma oryzae]PRY41059.1 ABC-type antimicrobial peptide transport system permease subunit [Spirosoma oryzae]
MFKKYLKIAWRNSVRNKKYSLINIVGLWSGILFVLLIGLYIRTEWQVNRTLRHPDQQYILLSHWKDPNMGPGFTTLAPLAKQLQQQYSTLVRNYYRWDGLTSVVSRNNNHFRESIALGDSTLLAMYGFRLLHGDAQTALKRPFSVALTAEKARKYFGRTDVLGQTVTIQNFAGDNQPFTITAVLDDLPTNSVTQLSTASANSFFIPGSAATYFNRGDFDSWQNAIIPSYLELQPGVTAAALAKPIQQLINQHTSEIVRQNLWVEPVLLTDYYRQKDNQLVNRMLLTLGLTGLFILLMAVVNFVNLTIGQSHTRIREIGVRKVLGSPRNQLIGQLLTESLLLTSLATGLAFATYPFARSYFEEVVGKPLLPLSSLPIGFAVVPFLLVLLVGLLAGFYPAVVLSSLRMVDAVKGQLQSVAGKTSLRKVLIGFQFCVAALVLIAAVLVTQQVQFFFGQKLGYDRTYVVSAPVPRDWSPAGVQRMEALRQQFARLPQVASVSLSHEIPNGNLGTQPMLYRQGVDSSRATPMQALITDDQYLNTYRIPLRSGQFFDGSISDSLGVVINEKAARALGYATPQAALGQPVRVTSDPRVFTIRGITSDFQTGSMHQAIQPLAFFSVSNVAIYRYFSFRLQPGTVGKTLDAIQARWAVLMPGSSFEYTFMDDTLRSLYEAEFQLQRATYLATALAALIALLGILGLVSIAVQRQTKAIGIRRVLGASIGDIVGLFVREFIPIMGIAGVVSAALAYGLMQQWLDQYAYRIDVSLWAFVLPLLMLMASAMVLTGSQAVRAALVNPVKSLKSE